MTATSTRTVQDRIAYVLVRKTVEGHVIPADKYTYVLEDHAHVAARVLNDEEADLATSERRPVRHEWVVYRAVTTYEAPVTLNA